MRNNLRKLTRQVPDKRKTMKEVFYVATVNAEMALTLLPTKYDSYPEAQAAIAALPKGRYQVQKFFEVS